MQFTLAHGTANDFVVLPDPADTFELTAELTRALADRRRGLGADGVIRIGSGRSLARSADATDASGRGQVPAAQVAMDHRNADGSHAEMCGNGIRVVAKHAIDHGLATPDPHGVVHVATRAGTKAVRVMAQHPDGTVERVAVDMGRPVLEPHAVPAEVDDAEALLHRLELPSAPAGHDQLDVALVSMGNPHAVVVVDDVVAAPVTRVGPVVETHRRFPSKANVGFAQVVDRTAIRLRVWERGVGETAACGTGACAAVVALQRLGLVDAQVAVQLPGGSLTIEHEADGPVTMTGPAVEVAHGRLDAAWLNAV